jgi:acyl-CoA reductase-like NAD-dependent aldehyde dehydrogenase
MKIINPSTQEIIKELSPDHKISIQKKYELARKGQAVWEGKTLEDRINCI